jgi:hypothetical protein
MALSFLLDLWDVTRFDMDDFLDAREHDGELDEVSFSMLSLSVFVTSFQTVLACVYARMCDPTFSIVLSGQHSWFWQ